MRDTKNKHRLSQAMLFIVLFGIVSLFSDMTHEGASSIRGAYLSLLRCFFHTHFLKESDVYGIISRNI